MSNKQGSSLREFEGQEKQRPKSIFKIVNPIIKLILNSPFHRGLSKNIMVLSFTGRKSGRSLSTPVAYTVAGDRVLVVTFSAWWKNFRTPMHVSMRIQGKNIRGMASLVDDPLRIKEFLQTLITSNGDEALNRMGLKLENLGSMTPEEVQKATSGSHFIEIHTPTAS